MIQVRNYITKTLQLMWDDDIKFPMSAVLLIKGIGSASHPYVTIRTKKKMQSFARFVVEQIVGVELLEGEEVHHRDSNPLDNRWTNLLICSKEEHTQIHFLKEMRQCVEMKEMITTIAGRYNHDGYIRDGIKTCTFEPYEIWEIDRPARKLITLSRVE